MNRWQYKEVFNPTQEKIDELGEKGWELMKVSNESASELFGLIKAKYSIYYFKRPLLEVNKGGRE